LACRYEWSGAAGAPPRRLPADRGYDFDLDFDFDK
jgi:hypothetical protein